jgi:hypothetical protein
MKTNFSISLFFIFAFVFFTGQLYSQTDDNGAPYFPLRVGNAFYYNYYHCNPGGCDSVFIISRITNTKIFNGRRYYYISNIFGKTNQNYYVRYNSTNGYFVYLDTNNSNCNYEIALYNLSANVGDSVSSSCRGTQYKCNSIVDSAIFDIIARVKRFGYYHTTNGWVSVGGTYFARRIGCIYDYSGTYNNSFASYTRYLQGCKVNNVVYGDTIDHITPMYADSGKYMPLAIGNRWVYLCANSIGGPFSYWTKVSQIIKDTIINNKKYFLIDNIPFTQVTNLWVRYDSTNGHLNLFASNNPSCNNEFMFYNLSNNVGDSSNSNYMPCCLNINVCNIIKDTILFGINSRYKSYFSYFSDNYGSGSLTEYFAKNIGFLFYRHLYSGIHAQDYTYNWLKGCILNGIVYGDTTSVIPPSYADSARYLPLAVGNKWVYATEGCCPPNSSKLAVKVVKDSVINGKKYFYLDGLFGDRHWVRYDTSKGYLIAVTNDSYCNYETVLYNYAAIMGDSAKNITCANNDEDICLGNQDTILFGFQIKAKKYNSHWSAGQYIGYQRHFFAKGLGMYNYGMMYTGNTYGYGEWNLLGCYINGVLYGDTSIVTPQTYADSARYFPIAIGNKWVYDVWRYPEAKWTRESYKILRDTIINSRKYFYLEGFPPNPLHPTYSWISYDTSTGVLKIKPEVFGSSDDYVKLSSHTGDTLNYICNRISDTSIFNYQSRRKLFEYSWAGNHAVALREIYLVKNIGPDFYKYDFGDLGGYQEVRCILRGCVINGVLYGDTNTVGINVISKNIPDKYKLCQNYPNPFNPSTNIKYQIINNKLVTLKIYDILGKEVATLVNEKQSPGYYEVTWDASNYPSEVYFYKVVCGDFSEVKKMILIK